MSQGTEFLTLINEKLKHKIQEVNHALLEGQKEIESMHTYYWDNYTEMDQYGYENFDNQQALFQQVNANQEQFIYRQRLEKMIDSPFFGRVDFCYEGEEEPEQFYIGIGNFSEKTGHVPLIYDWRAPVSGLFYDYDKGALPVILHRQVFYTEKSLPNGSTKSAVEKWFMNLKVT